MIELEHKHELYLKRERAERKSKALWAAHDFYLCGKTSLCAKLFVWKCTSPVRSFSLKSTHFDVKCFAWTFVLKRGQGKKQLQSGSKVCIRAKWPFRLAVIPVSVAYCRSISTTPSLPDGMLIHCMVTSSSQNYISQYLFIHLSGKRQWELRVLLRNTIQCSQSGLEARLLRIEKKYKKSAVQLLCKNYNTWFWNLF